MTAKYPVKVVVPEVSLGEFEVGDFTPVDAGGTGAVNAATARTNLGAAADADLTSHENDVANPHSVTAGQVGAEPANANIQSHISSTANPHSVTAAQAGALPTTDKAQPNGIASLDGGGKVPVSQIPATALPQVYVVADEAERLALTVQEGDEAIQLDDGSHWIYDGTTWYERPQPATFPLEVQDDGVSATLAATRLNFVGFTITEPVADQITVKAPDHVIVVAIDGKAKDTFYTVMDTLVWPGSTKVGVPTSITANMHVKDVGDIGDFRLYDATNGLTIAELFNIVSDDPTDLIDLGSIANVSTGEALWEIQGLESTGAKGAEFDLQGMTIYL